MDIKIMLMCKKTLFCEYAVKILKSYFDDDKLIILKGDAGTKINDELHHYEPEFVVSFLSPWIVPSSLLKSARKAAINFHPGSPRYPGSGCYNFAIYDKACQYGVTCHHMEKSVDTGDIIMTSYFDISPNETVESLKLKSMNHLLFIFEKVIHEIYANDSLPKSDEKWQRHPYTKKMLADLCRIDPNSMDNDEVNLRIRATDYCSLYDGAYIEIGGCRFFVKSSVKEPLA